MASLLDDTGFSNNIVKNKALFLPHDCGFIINKNYALDYAVTQLKIKCLYQKIIYLLITQVSVLEQNTLPNI